MLHFQRSQPKGWRKSRANATWSSIVFSVSSGSMKFVDWFFAPFETSISVTLAAVNFSLSASGLERCCSICFA